jgi:hypothetical protein
MNIDGAPGPRIAALPKHTKYREFMIAALGRRIAMKVVATLIVLLFLSTALAGSVRDEPVARMTAAPSSFSMPIRVNDNSANEQTGPVLVAIPGGKLFAVWEDSRSCNAIYSSRSFDNGRTFAPSKRIDDPIFNSSTPRSPAVAVSKNGTILVTWQDNRRGTFDYDIFLTKSYDGGATFTKNVKVDDSKLDPSSWQERPSIAIALGGTIYISWIDDRSGILRARGAYSTDMGVTFSPSKEIAPSGTSGQNEVDLVANGDRIFAAFIDNSTGRCHPYVSISNNGGKSFTAPIRLDNTGSPGMAQKCVSIAPMPSGGIVAIWADSRNGDSDLYASIVSAEGNITLSNIRVEDDSSYAYNWQEGACVAADQIGNIYAAWQDERTSGYPAIRFALMKTGKTQFITSVEVARPGNTDMQMRPSITVRDPGQVYVAWQDDKAGTNDIYVSSVNIPNLYALSLSGGWNFVSMFLTNSSYRASTLGLKNGDIVAQWNSSRGAYDGTYIVGISSGVADFPLSESTGYWIYAAAAETIGLNGTVPTTRRASDIPAMYDTPDGVMAVASFNPTTGRYSTYFVGLPSTDFKVVPGQAYWCWCVVSGVITYDP